MHLCCEAYQTECGRPYGTASFYFQTALSPGTCQSVLTKIERSNEPVVVCHRVLSALQDPCPSSGRRLTPREDPYGLSTRCRKMMQTTIVQETLILILRTGAGDAMFFNLRKCSGARRPVTRAFILWLEACGASHAIREGFFFFFRTRMKQMCH